MFQYLHREMPRPNNNTNDISPTVVEEEDDDEDDDGQTFEEVCPMILFLILLW
jgi:hypothetical protein